MTVNCAIDSLTAEINEHYEDIRRSLGFVTAELVKNAMKGIGRKPSTLLALFREHNEEFHKRVGVDRTKESYESYLNSYRHLSAFVTENGIWRMCRSALLTGLSMTTSRCSSAQTVG